MKSVCAMLLSGICACLAFAAFAPIELELSDELDAWDVKPMDYYDAMNYKDAMWRLQQIRESLSSFAELAGRIRRGGQADKKTLEEVGNSSAETHTIAFANWPTTVEGTLRRQHFLIKKLEYELAIKRFEDGETPADEVDVKMNELKEVKRETEAWFNNCSIAD